jgi:hypothetical protein
MKLWQNNVTESIEEKLHLEGDQLVYILYLYGILWHRQNQWREVVCATLVMYSTISWLPYNMLYDRMKEQCNMKPLDSRARSICKKENNNSEDNDSEDGSTFVYSGVWRGTRTNNPRRLTNGVDAQ